MVLVQPACHAAEQVLPGLYQKLDFGVGFDPSSPSIEGADAGDQVDAGRQALFDERTGELLPGSFIGSCAENDDEL